MATPTKDQLIRFRCECGKKLKATCDIVGKKVKCTRCDKTHRVPESDQLGSKSNTTPKPASKPAPSAKTHSAEVPTANTVTTAASKKKNKVPTLSTSTSQNSVASDKSQSFANAEQPSLFINDELAANEPSLLPGSDDSDSRFKLDPKFDPKPIEQLPDPDNRFEFEPADLQLNTDASPKQDNRLQTQSNPDAAVGLSENTEHKSNRLLPPLSCNRRSVSKTTILACVAVVLSVVILSAIGWFVFNDSSYPAEFSERPEVRNYVTKIQEFRKSKRELEIVSEAYVKSKSPTREELEQINAFNRSIEPLANEQEKLTEALELFQTSQADKARSALISATETLDQKIPELQARAKDFASKLR